jgi:hypothetical protein
MWFADNTLSKFDPDEEGLMGGVNPYMKKILLLGLIAIGMSVVTMSARANGFGFAVTLSRPCPPIFVGPTLPIVAPPPAVGGCEPTVIVRGYEYGRFHNPVFERHEVRFLR